VRSMTWPLLPAAVAGAPPEPDGSNGGRHAGEGST
jgi:hypothetical protein